MGTSRLKIRRRQDQGSKFARILIAILATIGIIDTGTITIHRWGWISSLSCPGGSDACDKVLNSAWGTIIETNTLSVPLSFLGFSSYLLILVLSIITFLPWLSGKKIDISRSAWWGLFIISNCMTIFSFLLMSIMIIKIEDICFFCILSAVLSSLIFLITIIGGGWEERRELVFRGILISIVVLLGGLIWSSNVDPNKQELTPISQGEPPLVESLSSDSSIKLAKYLSSKNITLYNAYWCPHCHEQKEMFGKEAVSSLILVECASDGKNSKAELCKRKGINGYPSWEINGKIFPGTKTLNELADLSNYSGERDF